jgi:hypothetical protein
MVAVTAGAAVTANEFLDSPGAAAQSTAVTCSLWAMAEPSSPVTTQGFPAAFSGRLVPGTAKCADPQGKITGAAYTMQQFAVGAASCTVMQVVNAEIQVRWFLADGSTAPSTIKVGRLTLDPMSGPSMENATLVGGPDAVAGKPVSISVDQQTIDATKASARTQCLTGGVKNVVGNVNVVFG